MNILESELSFSFLSSRCDYINVKWKMLLMCWWSTPHMVNRVKEIKQYQTFYINILIWYCKYFSKEEMFETLHQEFEFPALGKTCKFVMPFSAFGCVPKYLKSAKSCEDSQKKFFSFKKWCNKEPMLKPGKLKSMV